MARIAGVDLPKNKRGEIGLTYIYGIGPSTARYILDKNNISRDKKVNDWKDDDLNSIRNTITEEFKVMGEDLVNKVKELIREGNIRKITIHDKSGKELMSFPLTVGVVGTVFMPVLAAVGAIAAMVTECSITVEKEEEKVS